MGAAPDWPASPIVVCWGSELNDMGTECTMQAISVLAHPGAGDLPWGLIVIANLAVGLVVVSAAVAFGA